MRGWSRAAGRSPSSPQGLGLLQRRAARCVCSARGEVPAACCACCSRSGGCSGRRGCVRSLERAPRSPHFTHKLFFSLIIAVAPAASFALAVRNRYLSVKVAPALNEDGQNKDRRTNGRVGNRAGPVPVRWAPPSSEGGRGGSVPVGPVPSLPAGDTAAAAGALRRAGTAASGVCKERGARL